MESSARWRAGRPKSFATFFGSRQARSLSPTRLDEMPHGCSIAFGADTQTVVNQTGNITVLCTNGIT
ncbi:MAG: hypothetical protein GAK35_03177 [Herbaspirillum frisingense]|uniref:Uncharacterized protein n=1 Tax=Herbaspirillum frisingense TaxID=92645 RepID=A0A7V8JTJ2_9BURK|nr:MAG: hypothetical protein GAK35_03177 [Herbaspirillum frisingense]